MILGLRWCSTPFGITEVITAFGELHVIPELFRIDFEHRCRLDGFANGAS